MYTIYRYIYLGVDLADKGAEKVAVDAWKGGGSGVIYISNLYMYIYIYIHTCICIYVYVYI